MENTNSKSKRSIALLLALCMLTSFCSYTIAKYMTIGEGNDFARVAKWGITFDKGSSEMFATTYNTGVDGKGTKVVAPGTSGSGIYILEGTPETAYEITFNTEGTSEVFLGKGDWKYVENEGYSTAMNFNNSETGTNEIYYPIKYTVTLADTVGTVVPVVDTEDFLVKNTPVVFNSFVEAAKVINNTKVTFKPNTKCDAKITVNWAWAFDGQNDTADTILGDLAAKNPDLTNVATAQEGTDYNVNISYKFSLTAKQIMIEPEPVMVVEVSKEYVETKDLVLVHTNNTDISFKYNDIVMYDVSAKYLKNGYTRTYGLVVDTIDSGSVSDYKENITIIEEPIATEFIYQEPAVAYDVNNSGEVNLQDVVFINSTISAYEDYFTNYMIQVFYCDTNNDKKVNDIDSAMVREAYNSALH